MMMKVITSTTLATALLVAVGTASAFVTSPVAKTAAAAASIASSSSSLNMAETKSTALPFLNRPRLLDGSMAGDVGFDPLGLSNIDDVGIDLYWLREAEIKHGRVAMLATAGFLQVELFGPAPGCEAAIGIKCQTDAFWAIWNGHPQYVAAALLFIALGEMVGGIATTSGREDGSRAPGDFGLDPLGYGKGDAAKFKRLQTQEIKNGR